MRQNNLKPSYQIQLTNTRGAHTRSLWLLVRRHWALAVAVMCAALSIFCVWLACVGGTPIQKFTMIINALTFVIQAILFRGFWRDRDDFA